MSKNFGDDLFDLDEILEEENQKKVFKQKKQDSREDNNFLESKNIELNNNKIKKTKENEELEYDFLKKFGEKQKGFDIKIDFDKFDEEDLLIENDLLEEADIRPEDIKNDIENKEILKNLFNKENRIKYSYEEEFTDQEDKYQEEDIYLEESEVLEIIKNNKKYLIKKFLVLIFCFLISIGSIVISSRYDLMFDQINIGAVVNLVGLFLAILCCSDFIINNLKSLFTKKVSSDIFVSLACIFTTIQSTLAIFNNKVNNINSLYSPSVILILFFNILSKYKFYKIMKTSSKYISSCENINFVNYVETKNILEPDRYNISCFSQESNNSTKPKLCLSNLDFITRDKKLYIYLILLFCFSVSGICFLNNNNIYSMISSLCCMFIIAYPLSSDFCFKRAIYKLFKKLYKNKILLYKYLAIDKVKSCENLIIDNNICFDQDSFKLIKIKIFDYNKINDSIINISSLLDRSESLLSKIFLGIINNKTTLIRKVKNFKKNNNGGLSGEINGESVFFGTSDYLLDNNIVVPSKYVKLSNTISEDKTLKALYVAINGVLTAMFLIKLNGLKEINDSLEKVKKEGLKITLCLKDVFISSDDVSFIYNIDRDDINEILSEDKQDINYKNLGILNSKNLDSLILAVTKCININKKFNILYLLKSISLILTSCLVITFIALGAINYITFGGLILIQLFWLGITLLIADIY
ncbi:MAG: hypothetical protein J6C55_01625 [Oscillospiraceae bacterium]|nr:hypothetical protein [Oscillospiraceae bacterium]